jgi:4-carboxymuconolactone decarboxylase
MARVPLRSPSEVEPDARAVLERIAGDRGDLPRVYASLANSPRLFTRLYAHVEGLWKETTIPRVLQELIILRVAQRMGSDYEWGRHRLLAGRLGVPEEQVNELANWSGSSRFDERERAALAFTDGIAATGLVAESAFAEAGRLFNPQEIVEIAELAGFYVGLARYLAAIDVTLESGFERIDGSKSAG